MKKLLFIGAMLITGALSYGVTEVLQPGTGNNYSGSTKLQLRVDGNAVDPANGAWLEITPIMSKGSNNSSLEFRFGELTPEAVAITEGSFAVEVKEYSTTTVPAPGTETVKKLKLGTVNVGSDSPAEGGVSIALLKNGTSAAKTQTSKVRTPASNQDDATITYSLIESKGGLVGSGDRYVGYIESRIDVEQNAKPGDFYDNTISLLVKVKGIEGERAGTAGTP
jgi:hypothetical protein